MWIETYAEEGVYGLGAVGYLAEEGGVLLCHGCRDVCGDGQDTCCFGIDGAKLENGRGQTK